VRVDLEAVDARLLAIASLEGSAKLLVTIPGVDVTVAIALLAAIGDVGRFDAPGQLAGLLWPRAPREPVGRAMSPRGHHQNGIEHRPLARHRGRPSRGSLQLAAGRHLLAVRRKRGHNVAVTALARKIIVVVWYLLQRREPYRYAPLPRTREKLRRLTPSRTRSSQRPETLDDLCREAGLPTPARPTPAERRVAARNRTTITRLSRQLREERLTNS
jgi:hypothetical protein